MRRSRRALWWTVFGAGSVAVVGGLAWITGQVIRLEREEARARAEVAEQETLHLALWRMDSWLAPHLARESARTWFEYQSYYPEMLALNRLCEPLAPGEVVVPSPLLEFRSELFPLHVQYSRATGFTSPQVPSPEIVTSGVVGCLPGGPDDEIEERLRRFALANDGIVLMALVRRGEPQMASEGAGSAPRDLWSDRQRVLSRESVADFKARQLIASQAQSVHLEGNAPTQQRFADPTSHLWSRQRQMDSETVRQSAEVGPLVPIWLGLPPTQLLLARRVSLGSEELLQGVVIDWRALQHELLNRIEDLYPVGHATLEPVVDGSEASPGLLASLPIRLVPPPLPDTPPALGSGIALGLVVVWLVSLGAIGATGIAMHSTLRAAMHTSRFASSVTHELRTPLTTFRLYAEMLSDGLIADPERAKQYLHTLRDESTRLGLLVENVLAWSRLEEGRKAAEPREIRADELISDAEPVLKRRCEEAGATLTTRRDASLEVRADPSRVRQILFNLVDNACKYAGEHPRVEVSATRRNGSVVLAVDDDGPGVPAAQRQSVFRAFDRGALGPGDSVRGLGLGLSISQELAKSLGGSLRCRESPLGGARFELELPLLAVNSGETPAQE